MYAFAFGRTSSEEKQLAFQTESLRQKWLKKWKANTGELTEGFYVKTSKSVYDWKLFHITVTAKRTMRLLAAEYWQNEMFKFV